MKPRNSLLPGDTAGHKYQSWYAMIDTARTSVDDLFRPQYWIACLNLKSNDIIRCVADDGSYDFCLKVTSNLVGNNQNAITVSLWPQLTPEVIAASEGTAATELVPTVLHGKPVPRVESFTMSGNRLFWRLIGFDGEPVGEPFALENAADEAFENYVAAHGITHEAERPAVDILTGDVVTVRPPTQVNPSDNRPGQFSYAKKKQIAKREAKLAKRRELDERNKARTAERQAAEAAGDAA